MKHLVFALVALAAGIVGWWQTSPPAVEPVEVVPVAVKKPKAKKRAPVASTSGLTMPTPEACIAFDADPGDEGMVAPGGLDRPVVKAALDKVLSHALSCGTEGNYRIVFELVIGCDGVMKTVQVSDDDGADGDVTACIGDVLRHADFPGHDMPDGMSLTYPVSVEF
jgi:hypothetical protein